MQADVNREFLVDEISTALKQMYPTKASRPNGMSPISFQKYWHIVCSAVTQTLLQALNLGLIPPNLNHSNIVLIPKNKQPLRVADYRSISLCNIFYKIISKVIANRLKVFLPNLISELQSAFVPRRQITDNILVTYEIVHFLRRKDKGKKGYMSIKLDMNKAYDKVEWDQQESTLSSMEFPTKLTSLIMQCIKSA